MVQNHRSQALSDNHTNLQNALLAQLCNARTQIHNHKELTKAVLDTINFFELISLPRMESWFQKSSESRYNSSGRSLEPPLIIDVYSGLQKNLF